MGLFQRAIETYDSHIGYTGNREGMSPMAPVGHSVVSASLEITLDRDGRFVSAAAVAKDEPKIVIPVTENSAGRTSAPCPHPLCEQFGYLLPKNKVKYEMYVEQLKEWAESEYSHPKLRPILQYVLGGTVEKDLENFSKDDKSLIRWRVLGEQPEDCWRDDSLLEAYTRYSINNFERDKGLCLVTGTETGIAKQHPKGVFALNGNAKLISANDSSGFTYRGRLAEEWQSAQVGYIASQKAHNALRWLIQEEGKIYGGRAFLCWNPQGKTVESPTLPFRRSTPVWQPDSYREELSRTLVGKKQDFTVNDGIVVAVFDASTKGRLALTYYNEFRAHDFLERLYDWDSVCCWPDRDFGIRSPDLRQIVNCAFGMQTTEKNAVRITADDQIMRQQLQRMLACRIEKVPIGTDVVRALADKASCPQSFDRSVWEYILFTACAVIRKYRYDRFKEEWDMALEPEKQDRSYQFGRLLAVMEKAEADTYGREEARETNAIRMQSVFCRRPMYAAGIIEQQLEQAYFPQLSVGIRRWYKGIISQIMEQISAYPQESWNLPLEDSYLMGYYLQRNALYSKNHTKTEENNNEHAE